MLTIGGLAVLKLLLMSFLGLAGYFAAGLFYPELAPPVKADEPAPEPLLNHIAFVGNDDNLWLVAPDGSGLRHVTTDSQIYRTPTWSPDGRYLAYTSTVGRKTILHVTPTTENSPTVLFDQEDSSPFYLYWVPDSQAITFLTQEVGDLAMRQAEVNVPGQDRVLGEGSPFAWAWSPASDRLLMHVGGARAISEEAHLSILPNETDAKRIKLELAPGRFQAPLWSPDGQYVYYIAADDEGQEAIYKMDPDTLESELLAEIAGFAYMVLSPNSEKLAYLEIERSNQAPFGKAYVINTDGTGKHRVTNELVGSMYWSPDSTRLALLTPARRSEGPVVKIDGLASPLRQELVLRWWVYDVTTEELEGLISFRPTLEFLQTVPYFDQYHLSLTFWSPDSRYLVVTDEEEEDHDSQVLVVDITEEEEPLVVGEGTLAVWSWK
jgi:Tol biopolymer transport system component